MHTVQESIIKNLFRQTNRGKEARNEATHKMTKVLQFTQVIAVENYADGSYYVWVLLIYLK